MNPKRPTPRHIIIKIFYPASLWVRIEVIKNFSDLQKLKEYSNTKPFPKRNIERSFINIRKVVIYWKEENHNWKVNYLNRPVFRLKKQTKNLCGSDNHMNGKRTNTKI